MKRDTKSIWTSANVVTVIRIALVPVWLLLAEVLTPSDGTYFSYGAFFVFIFYSLLSLTDSLDGYLARSRNEVSTFGKFLDPIADKLVVVVVLAFLLKNNLISTWVLSIIVAREFLVSGLRMLVASSGTVVAASILGKLKTLSTMVSLGLLLLTRALPQGVLFSFLLSSSYLLLYIAVILTVWSGIDYFMQCWKFIDE